MPIQSWANNDGTIPLLVNQAVLGQNLLPAVSVVGGLPSVPGWLVSMINKNQYVDFALLGLCNLNVLPNIAPTGVQLSRLLRLELQPILTFIDWAEAWAVYSSIVAQKHADKLGDLLRYFLLIVKANGDVKGTGWLAHDTAFQKQATGNTSVSWTLLDPTTYMSTVVADGVNNQVPLPSASAHPSSFSVPRSRQRNVCYSWNSWECQYPRGCNFQHVCSLCGGEHKRKDCCRNNRDSPKDSTSAPVTKKTRNNGLACFYLNDSVLPLPPIISSLNIFVWREFLRCSDHPDSSWVLQGLLYGFSIGIEGGSPVSCSRNCLSAYQQPEVIDCYLKDELLHGTIAGPFSVPPLPGLTLNLLG